MSEVDAPFTATLIYPEGWVVLGPWIHTQDGEHKYRPHMTPQALGAAGYGEDAEKAAKHMAAEFNRAVARHYNTDE